MAASRGESLTWPTATTPAARSSTPPRAYDDSTRAVARALGIDLEELDDWNCCGATEYIAPEPHRPPTPSSAATWPSPRPSSPGGTAARAVLAAPAAPAS